jgi:hypothetical protein
MKVNVALGRVGFHGVVLIQVKGYYVFKAQPFFLMQPYQFIINTYWRYTGSQALKRLFDVLRLVCRITAAIRLATFTDAYMLVGIYRYGKFLVTRFL